MLKTCLVLSVILSLVLAGLTLRPEIDLDWARVFYTGSHRFIGDTPAGIAGRYIAWALPFVVLAVLVIATALARTGVAPPRFALSLRDLAFLIGTMLLAPGLAVHVTLKERSHRPRPYNVTEFGGADRFRPFYRFDGACRHDCSFASGETALATWTLAPASLAPPPWRGMALAAALLFACITGGWRMALGAHFLSDVAGAMLITLAVVLACRPFLRRRSRRLVTPNDAL